MGEFGDCSHPLDAELEETVRQAASRAAARANMRESSSKGTGEDIASKAAQRQRLQLPGFALASFGFLDGGKPLEPVTCFHRPPAWRQRQLCISSGVPLSEQRRISVTGICWKT